jgi:hypothetical protein
MKAWIMAPFWAAGIAVGTAAPGAADESSYLAALRDQLPFLTTQQLLTEGYKTCEITSRESSSNAVTIVEKDLAVSVAEAYYIVSAAVVQLGC